MVRNLKSKPGRSGLNRELVLLTIFRVSSRMWIGGLNMMDMVGWLFITDGVWNNIAIFLLRVFVGVCFIIHGLGKLGIVGTGNMAGFVGWLKSLNVPFAGVQARVAMISEIVGGVLITLGLFHRVGCFLLFFTMVVAAIIGHRGGGYLITNSPPGNEYTINLAVVSVALFLLGPGILSLDFLILLKVMTPQ